MEASVEHSFNVELAQKYGVPAAIIIRHLQYWLIKNKANKDQKHFFDGRYWTYNSVEAFKKIFPYWSTRQIRTIIDNLVAEGVIVKRQLSGTGYDRRNWYAFVDEAAFVKIDKCIGQKGRMDLSNKSNPLVNSDNIQLNNPSKIPIRNTSQRVGCSPEEILDWDMQVGRKATKLLQELNSIFRPGVRSARTFAKAVRFMAERAQQDPSKIHWLTDAIEWARKAKASSANNRPGLFMAKVKKETGFNTKGRLL